ncbi:MAG: 2-amino-4-hydroxy-6-hydroxymethyldihydropteridine diphosphokinase [bacterium]|nr:MAG: 2-amino-4-hydroxy-6-hydroxymethyldihydropteridine diphosphokinase [bacterium]
MHGESGALVVFSLGANIGPREENVLEAYRLLGGIGGVHSLKLSSLYETEPQGEGYSGPFVNAVALAETVCVPLPLLEACMRIERALGRGQDGGVGDRTIDIDIILYGDRVIDVPNLRIPHPRFRERPFVLEPLLEVAPELTAPPDGRRIHQIREELSSNLWVRKISTRSVVDGLLNLC